MYPQVPDVAHLKALRAVASAGSISGAARELGIPQQTVSARIARCEKLLGLRLFLRTPTGVEPTERGKAVIGAATPLLDAAQQFSDHVASLTQVDFSGSFPIAVSHTIAEIYFATWAAEFRRARPKVRIHMTQANSQQVRELVAQGRVRLGLVEDARRATPSQSEVDLGQDSLILVVPPTHPWAERDAVTREELQEASLVVREPGSGTRRVIEEVLGPLGPSAGEFGSLSAMRSAIISLDAPGIIAAKAVRDQIDSGKLVQVPTPELDFSRRLIAVQPPGYVSDSAAEFLIGIAQNSFK